MNASKRRIEFALLTLVGIPGDIWCGLNHICIDGHLYHEDMPRWWLYADFIWVAAFVAAAVSALRSDLKWRFIPFGVLLFLVVSRMILASAGGGFFIFELPALIYLAVLSVLAIWRIWRQTRPNNALIADASAPPVPTCRDA